MVFSFGGVSNFEMMDGVSCTFHDEGEKVSTFHNS